MTEKQLKQGNAISSKLDKIGILFRRNSLKADFGDAFYKLCNSDEVFEQRFDKLLNERGKELKEELSKL